jgi:hypothetical protein
MREWRYSSTILGLGIRRRYVVKWVWIEFIWLRIRNTSGPLVNVENEPSGYIKWKNFLVSWPTINFIRQTLAHGVFLWQSRIANREWLIKTKGELCRPAPTYICDFAYRTGLDTHLSNIKLSTQAQIHNHIKGKLVPVLNWLITTPWRLMGEWLFRPTSSWPRY